MLRALWRLVLGSVALGLAIPFGCFVLGAGILADPSLRAMAAGLVRSGLSTGLWDFVHTLSVEPFFEATLGLLTSLLLTLSLPPVLAAVIGETLRFGALTWYGAASGLVTAALPWMARSGFRLPSAPGARIADTHSADMHSADLRATTLLFLAGAASGLVYWLVAGWSAGRRKEPLIPDGVELASSPSARAR